MNSIIFLFLLLIFSVSSQIITRRYVPDPAVTVLGQTFDPDTGDLYLCGYSTPNKLDKMTFMKFTSAGTLVWKKVLDSADNVASQCYAVTFGDSSYIGFGGYSIITNSNAPSRVGAIDGITGALKYSKYIPATSVDAGVFDIAYNPAVSNFYVAGYSQFTQTGIDMLLWGYPLAGGVNNFFGGYVSTPQTVTDDYANLIRVSKFNQKMYAIGGYADSTISVIAMLDSRTAELTVQVLDSTYPGGTVRPRAMAISSQTGNVYVSGFNRNSLYKRDKLEAFYPNLTKIYSVSVEFSSSLTYHRICDMVELESVIYAVGWVNGDLLYFATFNATTGQKLSEMDLGVSGLDDSSIRLFNRKLSISYSLTAAGGGMIEMAIPPYPATSSSTSSTRTSSSTSLSRVSSVSSTRTSAASLSRLSYVSLRSVSVSVSDLGSSSSSTLRPDLGSPTPTDSAIDLASSIDSNIVSAEPTLEVGGDDIEIIIDAGGTTTTVNSAAGAGESNAETDQLTYREVNLIVSFSASVLIILSGIVIMRNIKKLRQRSYRTGVHGEEANLTQGTQDAINTN